MCSSFVIIPVFYFAILFRQWVRGRISVPLLCQSFCPGFAVSPHGNVQNLNSRGSRTVAHKKNSGSRCCPDTNFDMNPTWQGILFFLQAKYRNIPLTYFTSLHIPVPLKYIPVIISLYPCIFRIHF